MGGVPLRPRADHRGAGRVFPTFFVWPCPDLYEFVVCRLEEWVGGPRMALGLGRTAFTELTPVGASDAFLVARVR